MDETISSQHSTDEKDKESTQDVTEKDAVKLEDTMKRASETNEECETPADDKDQLDVDSVSPKNPNDDESATQSDTNRNDIADDKYSGNEEHTCTNTTEDDVKDDDCPENEEKVIENEVTNNDTPNQKQSNGDDETNNDIAQDEVENNEDSNNTGHLDQEKEQELETPLDSFKKSPLLPIPEASIKRINAPTPAKLIMREQQYRLKQRENLKDIKKKKKKRVKPKPVPPTTSKLEFCSDHDFKAIDKHVLEASSELYIASVEELVGYLLKHTTQSKDVIKARALFMWLASQPVAEMEAPDEEETEDLGIPPDCVLQQLLKIRRGEMSYSELLSQMCSEARLTSKIITGYLKGARYTPGQDMTDDLMSDWLGLYLDGGWRLVDPRWAARRMVTTVEDWFEQTNVTGKKTSDNKDDDKANDTNENNGTTCSEKKGQVQETGSAEMIEQSPACEENEVDDEKQGLYGEKQASAVDIDTNVNTDCDKIVTAVENANVTEDMNEKMSEDQEKEKRSVTEPEVTINHIENEDNVASSSPDAEEYIDKTADGENSLNKDKDSQKELCDTSDEEEVIAQEDTNVSNPQETISDNSNNAAVTDATKNPNKIVAEAQEPEAQEDPALDPFKVNYKCNEFYFLTDPELFVFSHFPLKPEWQLMSNPLTLEEFSNMCYITSPFFEMNLKLLSHTSCKVIEASSSSFDIKFGFQPKEKMKHFFQHCLYYVSKSFSADIPCEEYVIMKIENGNILKFSFFLPQSGNYKFELYGVREKFNASVTPGKEEEMTDNNNGDNADGPESDYQLLAAFAIKYTRVAQGSYELVEEVDEMGNWTADTLEVPGKKRKKVRPLSPRSQLIKKLKKKPKPYVTKVVLKELENALEKNTLKSILEALSLVTMFNVKDKGGIIEKAHEVVEFLQDKRALEKAISSNNAEKLRISVRTIEKKKLELRLWNLYKKAKLALLEKEKRLEVSEDDKIFDISAWTEVRRYTTPHPTVRNIIQAVLLLLGNHEGKTKKWINCQVLMNSLGPLGLFRKIETFNPDILHPEIVARTDELLRDIRIHVNDIIGVSTGVNAFYSWALGVVDDYITSGRSSVGSGIIVQPADVQRQKEIFKLQHQVTLEELPPLIDSPPLPNEAPSNTKQPTATVPQNTFLPDPYEFKLISAWKSSRESTGMQKSKKMKPKQSKNLQNRKEDERCASAASFCSNSSAKSKAKKDSKKDVVHLPKIKKTDKRSKSPLLDKSSNSLLLPLLRPRSKTFTS